MLEKTENAFPKVTTGKDIKRGDHEFLFAEKKKVAVNGFKSDQLYCCSVLLTE